MSARSPNVEASTSRDPFQLDRLAEELVTRELAHHTRSDLPGQARDSNETHDLPVYIPLSHDNPYLTTDAFNVEEFLLSRSYTSLPDLRMELRDYLSILKEELVKLINDDYEAFISLSTDLRGEGVRLNKLKYPLGGLKSQVLESKSELRVIQDAIQEKLGKRATLREEKALLHLLLKISESVTRLESLLLIASPEQETAGAPENHGLRLPAHLSTVEENIDNRSRGNRAKHLGRVAAEYTQLLYHTSKAREDNCVFVDEIQWRIDRIQSTLSSDLDHLFAMTLVALTDGKGEGKATEVEKARWTANLTECLRTYDMLGLWRDAEDILRKEVVRVFVKKTIYPGALAAPHSPIVPHTPFPTSETQVLTSLLPRTPYTPWTAFASKHNPFLSNQSVAASNSPYAHLLDDSDDPLANLYNRILRFVERDLGRIMDIADKVSIKTVFTPRGEKVLSVLPTLEPASKAGGQGFEFMANVLWEELGKSIMDELGVSVFSAGRPNEFRKNHEITQAFIRCLEFLAPSVQSIKAMRSHPVYSAFHKRWQLPVYFQLRWKEIIGKLEDALFVTRIEAASTKDKNAFVTSQAAAVWDAISICWGAEVFIPELCSRFWKLTLQILSRYKTWLDQCLSSVDSSPKSSAGLALASDKNQGSPSNLSRASTPGPSSDLSTAESTAVDESLLRQYAAAIVDIKVMESNMTILWREEISMMLPEVAEFNENETMSAEDALQCALSKLASLVPPMSTQTVTILTRRCCDALLPVRSIPSQFRAMSIKRPPSEPSYFVSSILKPVRLFFGIGVGEGPGVSLKDGFLEPYTAQVFESVSERYIHYLTAMRKTEESLRRLKKGKKSTFSLFGSSTPAKDDEGQDEERIRLQMVFDVEAFGRDAESLGVKLESSVSFKILNDMVHAVELLET